MSRSRSVVLYGTRWQRSRFGIESAILRRRSGRSSSFSDSDLGDESLTETRSSRARAWLGMTPASSAR